MTATNNYPYNKGLQMRPDVASDIQVDEDFALHYVEAQDNRIVKYAPATTRGADNYDVLPCTKEPDLFFEKSKYHLALKLCWTECSNRVDCLAKAVKNGESDGVWGGYVAPFKEVM
jgi:hypothetical protein